MAEIITMMSGKGGAGKTSIAVNLAHFFATYGLKTLLVDCDLNTSGATAFFNLNKSLPDNLSEYLIFSQILQELTDSDKGIATEYSSKQCISIENNLDFIPATEISRKFSGQFSKETLATLKKNFYELMGNWADNYDIILLDQCAGYTDLIDIMMPLCTKVLLVREWNRLSLDTTRTLYHNIISSPNNIKILCCINKIPTKDYKNLENIHFNDLIPQIPGFELNLEFAELLETGKFITINDNVFCLKLSNIAKFVVEKYHLSLCEYDDYIKEIRTRKEQEFQENRRLRELENDRRWSRILTFYTILSIVFSIILPILLSYTTILSTPALIWIGLGTLIALIVVGLSGALASQERDRILRIITDKFRSSFK